MLGSLRWQTLDLFTHPLGSPRQVKPDSSHGCPQNGFCPCPPVQLPLPHHWRKIPVLVTHRHHQHVDTQVKLAACQARKELISVTNIDCVPC